MVCGTQSAYHISLPPSSLGQFGFQNFYQRYTEHMHKNIIFINKASSCVRNIGDALAFALGCAVVTAYWRIGAIFRDKDNQDWADLAR